jgi:hypothetical protein
MDAKLVMVERDDYFLEEPVRFFLAGESVVRRT